MDSVQGSDYRYADAELNSSHVYLVPAMLRALEEAQPPSTSRRVFDLGCGNGSVAAQIAAAGFHVVGADPSDEAIAHARRAFPKLQLHQRSAYDDLSQEFGRFPAVMSMEVIEHVYYPRRLLRTAYSLLEPGGVLLLTTPYHGYLKNLLLAVTGRLDSHFDALTDNGHIKFFSPATLRQMAQEVGFRDIRIEHIGRIAPIAKSMLLRATR
jgi:2-polyprenyl-6-hydroxyphenyl methylase/3-demethylubiquinone-9 3-methyltransferase